MVKICWHIKTFNIPKFHGHREAFLLEEEKMNKEWKIVLYVCMYVETLSFIEKRFTDAYKQTDR